MTNCTCTPMSKNPNVLPSYKIEHGHIEDIQKKLNQWKHKYWITIEGFTSIIDTRGYISHTMVIKREEKL